MALFKKSILLDDISGSIKGTEFVNSRYGPYIRTKKYPVNRLTESKQASKNKFSSVSKLWAKVNADQLNKWNDFATLFTRTNKVNELVPYRAIDLFKKINRFLIEINEPTILSPPKKVFPP